jgi:hypothetical protein
MFSQPSQFVQEVPGELLEEVRLRATVGGANRFAGPQVRRSSGPRSSGWGSDESTIVLDDMGERKSMPKPNISSFLRDLDEL